MNKAILIGNLGVDPKINHKNGITIAKFSLATSERWKDKNTGKMHERTEWHCITAFGKLAEICEKYLSKGMQVCIEGRIQTRSWEKDGIKKFYTDIIASTMKMLGTRNSKEVNSSSETSETSEDLETSHREAEEEEVPF